MKVAIVSTPRTCSSFLGNLMCAKYKLTDYSEIFSYNNTSAEEGLRKLQILKDTDNFSVKITSTSFISHSEIFSPSTFPWNIFDKIILAERKDVEYQLASWILLHYAQTNGHYNSTEIVKFLKDKLQSPENIPLPFEGTLNNFIDTIIYYYNKLKPSLIGSSYKVSVVQHELLQVNPTEYVDELNSILGTDISSDIISVSGKMELDYTPFVNYYNLKELFETRKNNATEKENADGTDNES